MRKRHGVLVLLVLVSVLTFLDRLAISVAGPRMKAELGISDERWGWVLSAFILSYGLFEVPTGAMGDRAGQRGVLARIVVWWSIFTATTGMAWGFVPLLITRFLFGIGEAGAYPNIAGSIARWFPPGERARTQGFIWGASRAGGALAPPIVLAIQGVLGWRATFWILGAVGLVWAACWYGWYRDEPAEQPGITEEELREIGAKAGPRPSDAIPWRRLLASRQVWLIVFMYGCYAWGSWFYFSWMPEYLVKGLGFTEKQMGVLASLPFLLGALANVGGGFLGDHLARRFGLKAGRRLLGSGCLAVSALLLVATASSPDRSVAALTLALGLGVMDLMLPTAWAVCLDIAGDHAGAVTGLMNMAGQAGGFACTVLFGYVVGHSGSYHAPLFLIAAMLGVSSLLFSRIDPTRRLVEPEPGVDEQS